MNNENAGGAKKNIHYSIDIRACSDGVPLLRVDSVEFGCT